MATERERRLESIVSHFLAPLKDIPFECVLKSLYGYSVKPFDMADINNQEICRKLKHALIDACRDTQKHPISRTRPNEVGNDMEPVVIKHLNKAGLKAFAPRTQKNHGKSTGYPDVVIEEKEAVIYLEVKTYAAANHDTTQRSFYISPSDDPKVTQDGHHLLVGFEIERKENEFWPVAFTVVDLHGMSCDMKSEFNSDNHRIYHRQEALILSEQVPCA